MKEAAWTSTRRSAGVTCAAAVTVLGSLTALFIWGSFFLDMMNSVARPGDTVFHAHPFIVLFTVTIPFFLIASGIRLGIGLFQLKPWARRTALIWAGAALCCSLLLIALRPYETFFIPEDFVSETESLKQLIAISLVFATFPISVWWIFLFRRKSVKRQFEAAPDSASANPS